MEDDSLRCSRCGGMLHTPGEPCPACLLRNALAGETDDTLPTSLLVAGETQPAHPTHIGPYRIVRVLGEGGMGVVYLAEQTEPIRRQVALKVIKLGMDTRDVVARFEAERQALALMDHPNIASVHDAGATTDGRPYFVMEYVAGEPITEYCDRQQLSTRRRLELFMEVCDAIQHAHQKGVIHRDIKPSNVLVVEVDGTPAPKVIDFGIAKATDQRLTERTMFTQHGIVIGTPEYMSPEQADPSGVDLDTRTDIYALGVVLYELLVGDLPFSPTRLREAAYSELLRIIREEEPVRPSARLTKLGAAGTDIAARRQTKLPTLAQELRGDLDWITVKALEKDRNRRYGSASELAADVQRYLSQEPIVARPPSLSYRAGKFVRRHRLSVTAVAVVAVTLVAGLLTSLAMYRQAEQARFETDIQRVEALGRAYIANLGLAEVGLRSESPEDAKRYLSLTEPSLRGWEYRHLLFRADPSLVKLEAFGEFSHFPAWPTFAFSADGKRVSFHTENTIHTWDASTYRRLSTIDTFAGIVVISPDARLAIIKNPSNREDRSLRIMEIDTGREMSKLTGHRAAVTTAAFSRDSRSVASAAADDEVIVWDVGTGRRIASIRGQGPRFLPDGLHVGVHTGNHVEIWRVAPPERQSSLGIDSEILAFSDDGRFAASSSQKNIQIWDLRTAKVLTTLRGHSGHVLAITFDASGARLASTGADHTVRVWETRTGRLLSTFLGNRGQFVSSVAFDPTGRRVFTADEMMNGGEVRVWDTSSSGAFSFFGNATAPITELTFSRDGEQVASGDENGEVEVWSSGRRSIQARCTGVPGLISAVAFDHGGERIVFGSDDKVLRVCDSKSGKILTTLPGHTEALTSAAFNHSGTLVVSTARDKTARIWDVATGRLIRQRDYPQITYSAVFSADDKSVFIGFGDAQAYDPGEPTLERWDWSADRVLARIDARKGGAVESVALSPNGSTIAVTGRSGHFSASVWTADLTQQRGELISYESSFKQIAFAADGKRIMTLSIGDVVKLWDARSFDLLMVLAPKAWGPSSDASVSAAISPDGEHLITSVGRTLQMWQARSVAEHRARELVDSGVRELKVVEDVIDRIKGDSSLTSDVRNHALTYASVQTENPQSLNIDSWRIVKAAGASADECKRALRLAEVAVTMQPRVDEFHNTLALALYRLGRHTEAIASARQAAALRSRPSDSDAIITVLARIRLGETTGVEAELARLVTAASKSSSSDLKALVQEAVGLVKSASRR